MLLIPSVVLQLVAQPTNATDKMQFIANIKLLHVPAPGCHPWGVWEQRNISQTR